MRRLLIVVGLLFVAASGRAQGIRYYPTIGGQFTSTLQAPAADNCTTPPFSFVGDATSGLCSSAAGTVNLRTAGTNHLSLTSTGATLGVPLLFPDGSVTAPSIAFTTDPDTGIFLSSSNPTLGFGGVGRWSWNSAGFYPFTTDIFNLGAASRIVQNLYLSRATQGSKSKSLTDAAAATAFVTVAVPTDGWIGGQLIWTATSVSDSDHLTTQGTIRFAGAATGTTPVCTVGVVGTDLAAVSGGSNTLVCTWTNVVASQTCALSVTCTNNLAGTQAITMYGRLDMPIAATLVFP